MDFIDDVLHYDELFDAPSKTYLVFQVEKNNDDVNSEILDNIGQTDLHIFMNDTTARSEIGNLYTSYVSIL